MTARMIHAGHQQSSMPSAASTPQPAHAPAPARSPAHTLARALERACGLGLTLAAVATLGACTTVDEPPTTPSPAHTSPTNTTSPASGVTPRLSFPPAPASAPGTLPAQAPPPAAAKTPEVHGPPAPARFTPGQPLRPSIANADAPPTPSTPEPAPAPTPQAPKGTAQPAAPRNTITNPTTTTNPTTAGLVTLFPGVRVDRTNKLVEFDATVPIDAHDKDAPNVYLELIACTPDTREHEALLMTTAKAAHIHAALLLIGLEPGAPGRLDFASSAQSNTPPPPGQAPAPRPAGTKPTIIAPRGPIIDVELLWTDALKRPRTARPHQWIKNADTGENFPASVQFVFGGSRFTHRQGPDTNLREFYQADADGTLISLATFGTDTIGPARVFSPDAGVDEPVWIADATATPTIGTKVTVRLRPTGAWFGTPTTKPAPSPQQAPTPAPTPPRTFENVPR